MADTLLGLIKVFAIMLSIYFIFYAFHPLLPFYNREVVKQGATICAIIVLFLIIAHIIITF